MPKENRPWTYFAVGSDSFDPDWAIQFCKDNGFGQLMLSEYLWTYGPAMQQSRFKSGHKRLKELILAAHDSDLKVMLHARVTEIGSNDPLSIKPWPYGVVKHKNTLFIDPRSELQKAAGQNLAVLAHLLGADGLYLDGGGLASIWADTYSQQYYAMIRLQHLSVIESTTKRLEYQFGCTPRINSDYADMVSAVGQRDTYHNVYKNGAFNGTRSAWNDMQIAKANDAEAVGLPAQLGWTDFYSGPDCEDQTPEHMQQLCDKAREKGWPLVLQASRSDIETHPERDEILEVIRG